MNEKKRLSKALSAAGVGSRRGCEQMIFDGRVSVNGETVLLPQTLVSWQDDTIEVDGEKIRGEEKKVYYLLNKPAGYICSNKRMTGRSKLVVDLFQNKDGRLFTVGRLDKDTEGLIIITNDGLFAQKLIHPSYEVQKEYLVKTDREVTPGHLEALSSGTVVERTFVKPVKVKKVRKGTIRITVMEGKKHEVRQLMENAGLGVRNLKRIRLGHFILGDLPLGSYRPLSPSEIDEVLL